MNIAVVGSGSIGKRHIGNLLSLGISDISVLRRENHPVPEFPEIPVDTDPVRMFERHPDLVVVANPAPHHLDIAIASLENNCHVFVEKPLSDSWKDVETWLHLTRKSDLIAHVGFDLRFDPGLNLIREIIASGRLGKLLSVQAQVGQFLPEWRPQQDYRKTITAQRALGGGVILELIHELDYVQWICGRAVQTACLSGHLSKLEMDVEDMAVIIFESATGVIGSISLDCLQQHPSRTCKFILENGVLIWDGIRHTVNEFSEGKTWENRLDYSTQNRNQRFLDEMRHVIDCISEGKPSCVDPRDAAQALCFALAVKESARSAKFVPIKEIQ